MHRTLRWIAEHDGMALAEAIGSYFDATPKARLAACFDRYRAAALWNRDPRFSRAGVEWLRDAMLAAGYIRNRIGFDECVDNRFAERSVAEDPPALDR